jgi:hypothetical protein
MKIRDSLPSWYSTEYPLQPPEPVTLPSFRNVAVIVLPSATLDHIPFVSSNHVRFQMVLVRVSGGVTGIMAVVWAGATVAAGDAGACAGWLVHPVMRTARTTRPIQAMCRTFMLNEIRLEQ